MKVEVYKFNSVNDFEIKIDEIVFTHETKQGLFDGLGIVTEYIINKKFKDVHLIVGGGIILNDRIVVQRGKKQYEIAIGSEKHRPTNAKYFMNVLIAHTNKMVEVVEKIKPEPMYKFDL